MLTTLLIVLNTVLLGALIVLLATFKRSIPDIQQILDDVGADISEKIPAALGSIIKDPMVKRSMSVLGKESGTVRASVALKNRVAEKALGQSVIVKKALDYFGLSALEGLELMRDPTFGPFIQGFIRKGGQGLLKGFGNNGGGGFGGSSSPVIYGREE